jgi:hypothetical protein
LELPTDSCQYGISIVTTIPCRHQTTLGGMITLTQEPDNFNFSLYSMFSGIIRELWLKDYGPDENSQEVRN